VSTWYSQQLACAGCGHRFEATFARGIHARRVPEVREQILRGELHAVRCPACNASIVAHREIAYTDFERFQWVQVETPDRLASWAQREAEALALFDRVMAHGAPAIAPLAPRFAVRLVFDLDELRERLAIWDAGLDDAVVECVKLVCVRERPALVGPRRRIRLRGVEANGDLALAAIDAASPRLDVARWTVPAAVVAAEVAARADWQRRMPELFERGFVSLDRYLRAPAPA
jgi:hypothetical protein